MSSSANLEITHLFPIMSSQKFTTPSSQIVCIQMNSESGWFLEKKSVQILNLAGRYGYMKLVNEYVHETMIPYYKRQLSSATLPREPNVQAPTNNDVQSVIYVEKITTNTAAIIKGGSVLAVDQSIIREIDTIGNYGAVRNKPTKINGRTRKMVHIPTRNLHPDLVRGNNQNSLP
ncbi:uncharacterized protein LOC123534642 [Mercenaria mercenaria]|uniref:uncharacterized protein LOC123534642 n=1 Tax=Mercenaria mercenaria TaxID=6596 RepID=UPI00234F66B0|nr:uncharacterized protein LOC123534642 [Mercenaria mercenaria]